MNFVLSNNGQNKAGFSETARLVAEEEVEIEEFRSSYGVFASEQGLLRQPLAGCGPGHLRSPAHRFGAPLQRLRGWAPSLPCFWLGVNTTYSQAAQIRIAFAASRGAYFTLAGTLACEEELRICLKRRWQVKSLTRASDKRSARIAEEDMGAFCAFGFLRDYCA